MNSLERLEFSEQLLRKQQSGKARLAKLLDVLGIFEVLQYQSKRHLIVLNFHRLYMGRINTEFDDSVFGHSTDLFYQQLTWLRRRCHFVSAQELVNHLDSGERLPPNSVMVTFDDGYMDCFHFALPVMRELEIPGIFFIPTGVIEKGRLGWWDLISYILQKTHRSTFEINNEAFFIGAQASVGQAVRQLTDMMKELPEDQTADLVRELATVCEVQFPSDEQQSRELMSWEEIRSLPAQGIAIGSHAVSHRVLATLPEDQQFWELTESKSRLEQKIGQPVTTLAYPVGSTIAYNETTLRLAAEAGYKAAFSFGHGVNKRSITDRFDIKRMESAQTMALFKGQIALPQWAGGK